MRLPLVPSLASAWCATLGALLPATAWARGADDDVTARLAAIRADAAALQPFGLRGALLLEHDGSEQLVQGCGEVFAGGAPIDGDTLFNLGSNAKGYTAAAVLLLCDRGALSLDAPLHELLPGVPADKRAITVRQLLTHSAGLDHSGYFRGDFEEVGRDESVRRILARPLLFAPGKASAYSDAGYHLLAALVELRGEQPFQEFMHEQLLEPLGLERTGFWGPDPQLAELPDSAFASGRVEGEERGSGRQFRAPTWAILGAGGMVGSVRDVAAFQRAVHAGELLSDESATAYESAQFRLGPEQAEGFGFVVVTRGARTIRQSAGGTPQLGHNALVSWSQPDDWLIVVHTADASWRGELLAPRWRALLEGQKVAAPPAVVELPAERLALHAGRFVAESGARFELKAARGRLELAPLDGAGFTTLFASGGASGGAGDGSALRGAAALDGGARRGLDRLLVQRVDPGVEEWRAQQAAALGRETGHEVLGATPLEGGGEPWTFVRFDFERGQALTRFVFGPQGALEAVVLRTELPTLPLWPTPAGDFVPFTLGMSVSLQSLAAPTDAPATPTLRFHDGRRITLKRE
ncbi:MAG: beta-lactamase family protein [Planctomycetes bacterium]|nr:beta-lactamase family protein [Planctomycetota bacterium]